MVVGISTCIFMLIFSTIIDAIVDDKSIWKIFINIWFLSTVVICVYLIVLVVKKG